MAKLSWKVRKHKTDRTRKLVRTQEDIDGVAEESIFTSEMEIDVDTSGGFNIVGVLWSALHGVAKLWRKRSL